MGSMNIHSACLKVNISWDNCKGKFIPLDIMGVFGVCVIESIKDISASRLNTNAVALGVHLTLHRKLWWQQPPTHLQLRGRRSVFSSV